MELYGVSAAVPGRGGRALAHNDLVSMLLPRPRAVTPLGGEPVALPHDPAAMPVAVDRTLPPQGYRLVARDGAFDAAAADESGTRYARCTVAQMLRLADHVQSARTVPAGSVPPAGSARPGDRPPQMDPARVSPLVMPFVIEDWPDHATRGVMLDVSRDKVPEVNTLVSLFERLASWKVNHVQLYMEHTFAYRGHEEVWRDADPYDTDDLADLQAAATRLGMELTANQNTLGHFERWLRHERYRPLAIAPDGFEWLFGIRRRATTLDPAKPGSFELVADLLGQLVPHFESNRVHVGMDEPWELPKERNAEWADWLARLRRLPALEGKELLVWGDMPALYPDLLDGLPERTTVCEWGYEAEHPFDERLARLAAQNVPFFVCPGTSSWISVAGRVSNMLGNLRAAAKAGVAHGAAGYLVTDWGDMGHLQQAPVVELALAAGAAMGWCTSSNASIDKESLARLASLHAFEDESGALADALIEAGDAYLLVGMRLPNMSPLVLHLLLPQWQVLPGEGGIDDEQLDRVEAVLAHAADRLRSATPERSDATLLVEETAQVMNLLGLACSDARARIAGDGTLASVPESVRAELSLRLRGIIEEHERLWLARNRRGGLAESRAWLEHLGRCYETGTAEDGWFGPLS